MRQRIGLTLCGLRCLVGLALTFFCGYEESIQNSERTGVLSTCALRSLHNALFLTRFVRARDRARDSGRTNAFLELKGGVLKKARMQWPDGMSARSALSNIRGMDVMEPEC
jgi:hypothetical protein